MKRFTNKDLLKAMELQVWDKVKVVRDGRTYEIVNEKNTIQLKRIGEGYLVDLSYLVDLDIEILPRDRRVGDLTCGESDCLKCPLKVLSHCDRGKNQKETLYKCLSDWNSEYLDFDQEIFDLLKTRLDKEVE